MVSIRKYMLIFLGLIIIGVIACNKILDDIKNAKVDFVTHWGLKVADISMMINDTLNIPIDSLGDMGRTSMVLYPGEDGILEMHFNHKLKPITLDTIVKFYQDSTFVQSIEFQSLSNFFVEGNTSMGFQLGTFSNNDSFKKAEIDSLKLDGGIIRLDFNTFQHFDSKFTFTFPGITDENNDILKLDTIKPDQSNHSVTLDLTNHKVQVIRKNNKEYIIIDFYYFLESRDEVIKVKPTVLLTLDDLDIDYAYGNFGNASFKDIGEDITLFTDQLIVGEDVKIDFKRPQIELHIFNSFGLPFMYDFSKLTVYFPDGDSADITGVPDQIFIEAPTSYETNSYIPSIVKINPSTNIDLLIGRSPTHMAFKGDLILNPGNSRPKRNYLRDEDSLSVILDIDLPIELLVSKLNFRETFKDSSLFFASLDSSSFQAQEIELMTDVTNSFPFELDLQVYFADTDTIKIDSLFKEPVKINGSSVENSAPVRATYYSEKNRSQIKKLYETRNIILEASFETANAEEETIVSFKKDHSLDIQLTLFTKLNVQSGDK